MLEVPVATGVGSDVFRISVRGARLQFGGRRYGRGGVPAIYSDGRPPEFFIFLEIECLKSYIGKQRDKFGLRCTVVQLPLNGRKIIKGARK